jgi:hypothetical protein
VSVEAWRALVLRNRTRSSLPWLSQGKLTEVSRLPALVWAEPGGHCIAPRHAGHRTQNRPRENVSQLEAASAPRAASAPERERTGPRRVEGSPRVAQTPNPPVAHLPMRLVTAPGRPARALATFYEVHPSDTNLIEDDSGTPQRHSAPHRQGRGRRQRLPDGEISQFLLIIR